MEIFVNGQAMQLPEMSVQTLLDHLQLAGKRVALECNGSIVPRSTHATTQIQAGDRIEIVQAIGGG